MNLSNSVQLIYEDRHDGRIFGLLAETAKPPRRLDSCDFREQSCGRTALPSPTPKEGVRGGPKAYRLGTIFPTAGVIAVLVGIGLIAALFLIHANDEEKTNDAPEVDLFGFRIMVRLVSRWNSTLPILRVAGYIGFGCIRMVSVSLTLNVDPALRLTPTIAIG